LMVKVAAIVLPGVYGPGSTVPMASWANAELAIAHNMPMSSKRILFTVKQQ